MPALTISRIVHASSCAQAREMLALMIITTCLLIGVLVLLVLHCSRC